MGTLELSNLIQLEINENLRNISIPKKGVVFGVDGDIEVNRVAFVFPRYYSNFDMTEFSARVNYVNANGEANYYEADDMSSDDGDTATFSWLMTSDVTSYIGEVRFSVLLYKRLDERYVKKFGTRPATGRVLEGLDVESYVTPEQQLTLIEKMEKKFDAYVEAKILGVNHDIEDAKNGALDVIEEAKNDVDSFIASSKSEIDSLLSSSLDDIKNLTDTSKLNISTLTDEKLASLDEETVRQLKNIELAGVEETEKIRTAFSSAVSDIQAEGRKQADAVDSHGDSKIKEINDSTATSLANINSISEKQVEAIQLEGTKQTSSVSSEGNKQVSTVTSAGTTEVTKVKSASSTALSNIDSAKEYSISEITAKGTEQVKIIKDTSTSEISKVQAAGTSQVKSVSDEGKIQIDGVKSEGEKQVQSVSAKGTQSLQDIDTAKTAAVKSVNDQTKHIIDKVEQLKQNVNDKSDSVDETYEQMKKLHCIEISEEAPTNERAGLWVNPESNEEINIPEIKDEEVSGIDTWSSQKINHEIDSLKEDIGYVDTSLFMKEIIEIDYDSKYDGFAQADGLHTHTTRKGYRYNISGKQIIQVRGCAGGVIPLCVCFNSQDTVVQKFDAEKVFDNTVWQTITTPESTAYIYVNDNDNLGIVGCKAEKINKSYNARNHIEKAESDISDIKEDMIDKYSVVTSECSDWIYNTHYDASKTNGETPAERTDGSYSTRKIAVSKGEKYKLTTVVGYAKAYIMADANYDYLGNAYMYPQSSHAWKQEVVNITIPDNCKYLLFTAASEYVGIFKLERLSGLTFEAKEDYDVYFDLENWKERVSEEQAKNDFAWNAYDKGYVTFVMDDTRDQTGQFADLFISKNTPLCIGAIPSFLGNLVQNSVHGTTIKEVLNAVVKNGGEILAHGGGTFSTALTADSTDEDYYHAIVDSKKVLTKAGYEINGIITIGGGATAPDYEKCVKIMRPYYRYSDYYGHKTGVIQYDHERLGCYGLTLENLKAKVDECVAKKSWLVLFWHSTNEITLDNMSALIDYINTVNAEIITYKDLHDRFGSSKLEQRIKALESVN